jgi:hypothetical protein
MLLCPGLVSVADTHRRTWTEMGMSVVRDTKSIDAIDCCSVVTCPQHTYTHTHTSGLGDAAVGGDRGHRGGLRSREDSSKNSNNAAVAEYGNGGRSKKWRGGF